MLLSSIAATSPRALSFSFFVSYVEEGRVAYTKPQQRRKEVSERLRGDGDQIKFIDPRFERGQVLAFRKARRQDIP